MMVVALAFGPSRCSMAAQAPTPPPWESTIDAGAETAAMLGKSAVETGTQSAAKFLKSQAEIATSAQQPGTRKHTADDVFSAAIGALPAPQIASSTIPWNATEMSQAHRHPCAASLDWGYTSPFLIYAKKFFSWMRKCEYQMTVAALAMVFG